MKMGRASAAVEQKRMFAKHPTCGNARSSICENGVSGSELKEVKEPVPLRNRIVSRTAERMAAKDAAHAQVEPLERAVFAECLKGILRTGGSEAAGWREQRRDAFLIETYQENERRVQHLLHSDFTFHSFPAIFCRAPCTSASIV